MTRKTANTYQIGYQRGGDMRRAAWVRIGSKTLPWKRAIKLVWWLRRRGVMAFAF